MVKSTYNAADPVIRPHFVKRGRYLAALLEYPTATPDLPWPRDLYNRDVTIADLMAEDYPTPKIGRVAEHLKCACGCGQPHNNGASRTVRNALGNGWTVVWYRVGHTRRT